MEELDKEIRRFKSDAELIREGAEFKGERLELTPKQIERIRDKHEETKKNIEIMKEEYIERTKERASGILERFNQLMVETKDFDDYLERRNKLTGDAADIIVLNNMYEEAWEYMGSPYRGKKFDEFPKDVKKVVLSHAHIGEDIRTGGQFIRPDYVAALVKNIEKLSSSDQS